MPRPPTSFALASVFFSLLFAAPASAQLFTQTVTQAYTVDGAEEYFGFVGVPLPALSTVEVEVELNGDYDGSNEYANVDRGTSLFGPWTTVGTVIGGSTGGGCSTWTHTYVLSASVLSSAGNFWVRVQPSSNVSASLCSSDDISVTLSFAGTDDDGDGSWAEDDCDDTDPNNFPGNPEVCDGQDNDCDGAPDFEGPPLGDDDDSAGPGATTELDVDGDGFFDCADDCDDDNSDTYPGATEICDGELNDCTDSLPMDEFDLDGDGMMPCAGDCDDGDPETYFGAPELCDGIDNSCGKGLKFEETDNDGDGVMPCAGDCDPDDPTVYAGAEEVCDGIDNDCDGLPGGEEVDVDADGFMICEGDCDDALETVYPGADEGCDGLDSNCDGEAAPDEVDEDDDGSMLCEGDCDDADASASHDGTEDSEELCADEVDNDCDGLSDGDDEECDPFIDDSDGDRNRNSGCGCGVLGTTGDRAGAAWVLSLLFWLGLRRRT